jgi:glycosyltransferase involved in cell wall biosynthesis/tetratricopeptide (TPR) repeat protein
MTGNYVGRAREKILTQLLARWVPEGSAVCLLDGFPGCGKSTLAAELALKCDLPWVRVEASESETSGLQDTLLDLAGELEAIGISDVSDAMDVGSSAKLAGALRNVIRERRILIILDEAQRVFENEHQRPLPILLGVIQQLGGNPHVAGRLLVISNRLAEHAGWSERCDRHRLPALTEEEAETLLSMRLAEAQRREEIPTERRRELVRCLGYNPRAIQTLVAALELMPLEELMSKVPGMWEFRDVEVSPELVARLEHDILERALPHLDSELAKYLKWLSVYRRPFRVEAFAQFDPQGIDLDNLRRRLIEHFLLEHRAGWHELNAVAREIGVQRLQANADEWRQAHSLAGNYHLRHFKAHRIVGSGSSLAGSFAELRYHLYHAGRLTELDEAAHRFTAYLRRSINSHTPVPDRPDELDERIALLSVLLVEPGAKVLEYHLAHCLERRGQPGDSELALQHIRRATGPQAPSATWLLGMDLEYRFKGIIAADLVRREALRWIKPEADAFTIYQRGAELFVRADRLADAIALLRKGIDAIPPERNSAALYQLCGELLVRSGEIGKAIEVFEDGIAAVPAEYSAFAIYQSYAELLARLDRRESAIAVLQKGIESIPPEYSVVSLYLTLAELLAQSKQTDKALSLLRRGLVLLPIGLWARQRLGELALRLAVVSKDRNTIEEHLAAAGRSALEPWVLALGRTYMFVLSNHWHGALVEANDGQRFFPDNVQLRALRAIAYLALNDATAARRTLDDYKATGARSRGDPLIWLKAWIALLVGDSNESQVLIQQFAGAAISKPATTDALLELWQTARSRANTPFEEFYPAITRYLAAYQDQSNSAESSLLGTVAPVPRKPVALVVATEWDSAHGGLSTFNREFCLAMARAGARVICYVPNASDPERDRAATAAIELLAADHQEGIEPLAMLLTPPSSLVEVEPDLVIGHDRQTGPYAKVLQKRCFPRSRRIHFIHTAPEEIEPHKTLRSDATSSAVGEKRVQHQVNQAEGAELVVAVGPRLAREFAMQLLRLPNAQPPVHEFTPGLEGTDERTPGVPPGIYCLVLGRGEDYSLKGLDVAARAFGIVASDWTELVKPKLIVRGAPIGTGDELRAQIAANAMPYSIETVVREYSSDAETIQADLRQASVLLMPSCVEGFGLVGLEAIAAGVPILVSEKSGLAETLYQVARSEAAEWILPVKSSPSDPIEPIAEVWARALRKVLADRLTAFQRASALRAKLSSSISWDAAVKSLLQQVG